jgi:hypothetical protein
MAAADIHFFLNLRDQLKLYHWQTHVYARHVATDKILAELETNIDAFVEIYIGKYGRPKMTGNNLVIKLHNLTEAGATKLVSSSIKYLQGPLTKHLSSNDTDLINLRDELIASLSQLLYLFTLK